MNLLKFSKSLTKNEKVYEYVSHSFFEQSVYYMINSKFRKATNLVPWLEKQVKNPSPLLVEEASKITSDEDKDSQMFQVLKHVKKLIKYTGDEKTWDMTEYWQTAEETLTRWYVIDKKGNTQLVAENTYTQPQEYPLSFRAGDCEDGAILMYVLARLKGIPAHRLMLFAGDVTGGGHCWLGYRSNEYPLNYDFMDWCYWYKNQVVADRNKFYVAPSNKIYEYKITDEPVKSDYIKMWFAFNELDSYKYFKKI